MIFMQTQLPYSLQDWLLDILCIIYVSVVLHLHKLATDVVMGLFYPH